MYDYAIIIPCFNEAQGIQNTHAQLCAFFAQPEWRGCSVALVYVNDGSTDTTDAALTELSGASEHAAVAVFTHSYPINRGKGAAIREGVQQVDASHYAFIDADLAFPLSTFTEMYALRDSADLIAGQRTELRSARRMRWAISRALQTLTSWLLHLPVRDTQCGIKQFSRRVVTTLFPKLAEERFAFDVELIAGVRQQGWPIATLPVPFRYHSHSSVRFADGLRFIVSLFRISRHSH